MKSCIISLFLLLAVAGSWATFLHPFVPFGLQPPQQQFFYTPPQRNIAQEQFLFFPQLRTPFSSPYQSFNYIQHERHPGNFYNAPVTPRYPLYPNYRESYNPVVQYIYQQTPVKSVTNNSDYGEKVPEPVLNDCNEEAEMQSELVKSENSEGQMKPTMISKLLEIQLEPVKSSEISEMQMEPAIISKLPEIQLEPVKMTKMPEIQLELVISSEMPEIQPEPIKSSEMPEIQPEPIKSSEMPEIQLEPIKSSEMFGVQPETLKSSKMPEIQSELVKGDEMPDIQPELVKSDEMPKIQPKPVKSSGIPEEQISKEKTINPMNSPSETDSIEFVQQQEAEEVSIESTEIPESDATLSVENIPAETTSLA